MVQSNGSTSNCSCFLFYLIPVNVPRITPLHRTNCLIDKLIQVWIVFLQLLACVYMVMHTVGLLTTALAVAVFAETGDLSA